jgi:hypothetical protein
MVGFLSLGETAGATKRPPVGSLLFLLACDTEANPAVERYDFELDVEAFAVLMSPGTPDPGPKPFLAFTVTDLISDVAGALRACG